MGQGQEIDAHTCLSLRQQLAQTASLSDDELEYAAGTASLSSEPAESSPDADHTASLPSASASEPGGHDAGV